MKSNFIPPLDDLITRILIMTLSFTQDQHIGHEFMDSFDLMVYQ